MSEPKIISPLLDGFLMGEPMSDHHGVRCCPAIREETQERYIVKIVSTPASQTQLDALLLSGAFANELKAQEYFKELSEDICKEASILSRLSKLEGFVPYQSSQTVKMEAGVGFDVYLLSPYRRSLERQMRLEPLTHLAAVNLGLDMCAALAVCRRAGYLYVDLKPENIFVTEVHGYCIGDLGFIPMTSLKYASLPEKYRSRYTAPEITDAYAALTETLDLYALGLVLYQIYNNGEFPSETEDGLLPPPLYADYEMAHIILKACSPDPAQRWEDPIQMGKALVEYMQRNSINDTPIVPPPIEPVEQPEEVPEEFLTEEENDLELAELLAKIPDEEPPVEDPQETSEQDTDSVPTDEDEAPDVPAPEEPPQEEEGVPEEVSEEATEAPQDPEEDASGVEEAPDGESAEEDTTEDVQEPQEAAAQKDEPAEEDGKQPPRTELTEDGVTCEVAQMLAQADELLQLEMPEPVVAPDPIDVPIPPPILPTPEAAPEPEHEQQPGPEPEDSEEAATEDPQPEPEAPEAPAAKEAEPEETEEADLVLPPPSKKRRAGLWVLLGVLAVLIVAGSICAKRYYDQNYIHTIDSLVVQGTEDDIFVHVVSDIDEKLLRVICTDTYGNSKRTTVADGKATFTDLNPNTQYKIELQVSGKHKLVGTTTGSYTTAAQTTVVNFSAITGAEDGAVILNFTVTGPDSERWRVEYSAAGIESKTTSFTGKHVTLTGLVVGEEYTFTLIPESQLYLTGSNTLTFTPKAILFAQDLKVDSYADGAMTLSWSAPEGSTGIEWTVRCFNDSGYDQSITTDRTTATFQDLNALSGYTVTVTAAGMTQSQNLTVTADPINITGFEAEQTDPWSLALSWSFTGTAPENGWMLTYSIDEGAPISVICTEAQTTIALTPESTYVFEVRPVDEITYFGDPFTFGPVETEVFSGYGVEAQDMTFTLYPTPDQEYWDADDLLVATPGSTFTADQSACLLMRLSTVYGVSDDIVETTFVIRDSKNGLISADTMEKRWSSMWHQRLGTAQIPQLPTVPGSYALDIYMDDMYITTLELTIT